MDEAQRLLTALAEQRRYTYRVGGSNEWTVSYSAEIGRPRFSRETVMALVRAGRLAPVYPGTEAENEAFGLASYYGSALYRSQIADKIKQRDMRRAAKSSRLTPPRPT